KKQRNPRQVATAARLHRSLVRLADRRRTACEERLQKRTVDLRAVPNRLLARGGDGRDRAAVRRLEQRLGEGLALRIEEPRVEAGGQPVQGPVPGVLQLSCLDVVQVAQAPDLWTAMPDVIDDVRSGVERSAQRRAKRAVVGAVAPVCALYGRRGGNTR